VELLVTGADIVTMAASAGPARSMLVRDDRIAAVGPAERVRAAAAPDARVVGLEGAAVIPGLVDAHCHLCDVGYLASGADCSQPAAPDIPRDPDAVAGRGHPDTGGGRG
jgi:Predicted metal-dependent hydrolase with the TIM-barrel fold